MVEDIEGKLSSQIRMDQNCNNHSSFPQNVPPSYALLGLEPKLITRDFSPSQNRLGSLFFSYLLVLLCLYNVLNC